MKMKMKQNIFNAENPVTVHMQGGRVVAKGISDPKNGRLIGHARVTQQNKKVKIDAKGSLVLSIPRKTKLTVRGHVNEVVLKSLRNVSVEACQGKLSAKEVGALQIEGPIHGYTTLRTLDGDFSAQQIMGSLQAKQCKNLRMQQVAGTASLKQVGNLLVESDVKGDVTIKQGRDVKIERVHGNAIFKQVGNVHLEEVRGNLLISDAQEISITHVQGNATLKHLSSSANLNVVQGNLVANTLGPSLIAAQVRGNAHLSGSLQPGGEYTIRANGDVTANVEGGVQFTIRANGQVKLGAGLEQEAGDNGAVRVFQGARQNAAHVTIRAGGNVCINSDQCHGAHHQQEWGWSDWEWNWQDERGGSQFDVEEEVRRTMDEVFSEVKKASDTVRQEFERAFGDVDNSTGGPIGTFIRHAVHDLFEGLRPTPPQERYYQEEPVQEAAREPSSDELKMILKMVANGTITAEEGERLIQAMK